MTIAIEDRFEMPCGFASLEDFRRWARSDQYPDGARVDFIQGRIEIDIAAEELFSHGSPKVEITIVLGLQVKRQKLGHLFVDDARVSNVPADLSAEPDVVFVSRDAIHAGRVRLIPKSRGGAGSYVEIEGSSDMIAEIVSASTVAKDTKRLPKAYFKAEIPEYWLVDARREKLLFRIHHRGTRAYELLGPDDEGYQYSEVFRCWFRLDRHRDERGNWEYDLRRKSRRGRPQT
jgi:Uma2 family endonuclease